MLIATTKAISVPLRGIRLEAAWAATTPAPPMAPSRSARVGSVRPPRRCLNAVLPIPASWTKTLVAMAAGRSKPNKKTSAGAYTAPAPTRVVR